MTPHRWILLLVMQVAWLAEYSVSHQCLDRTTECPDFINRHPYLCYEESITNVSYYSVKILYIFCDFCDIFVHPYNCQITILELMYMESHGHEVVVTFQYYLI